MTTQKPHTKPCPSLAASPRTARVHYISNPHESVLWPDVYTDRSAEITCSECADWLLEGRMDDRGIREYRIPENVRQQDAQHAQHDILVGKLAYEERMQARMSEMIEDLREMREQSARRVSALKRDLRVLSS